jgi:hypothetical protein
MNVLVARAKVKAAHVTELEAAADKMFTAIREAQPEGIRYAWLLLDDGETFAAIVQVDDGVENTIPALPEYRELQERLADSLAEPPSRASLTVLGSYRLF